MRYFLFAIFFHRQRFTLLYVLFNIGQRLQLLLQLIDAPVLLRHLFPQYRQFLFIFVLPGEELLQQADKFTVIGAGW